MAIASFAAGELITAGQAVYVDESGYLYLAGAADVKTASAVGVAIDTGNPGSLVRVNCDAVYNGYSNLIPGDKQYLSILTSGQLVSYSGWLSEFNTNANSAYLEYVGRVISSSGVEVELSPPVFMTYPLA